MILPRASRKMELESFSHERYPRWSRDPRFSSEGTTVYDTGKGWIRARSRRDEFLDRMATISERRRQSCDTRSGTQQRPLGK